MSKTTPTTESWQGRHTPGSLTYRTNQHDPSEIALFHAAGMHDAANTQHYDGHGNRCLYDASGELVALAVRRGPVTLKTSQEPCPEQDANAARLAHCWNCHDDLVATIQATLDRSGGRLYDTDQVTGETFHVMLAAALARCVTGGGA